MPSAVKTMRVGVRTFSYCKRTPLVSICRRHLFLVWQLLRNIRSKVSVAVFWLLAITLSIICYSNKVSLMQSYSFLTNQPSAVQCQKAFLKQTKSRGGNHASSFLGICHFFCSFNGCQSCTTKTVAVGECG